MYLQLLELHPRHQRRHLIGPLEHNDNWSNNIVKTRGIKERIITWSISDKKEYYLDLSKALFWPMFTDEQVTTFSPLMLIYTAF